ncbi:MAG: hypothetical protein HY858_02400 [Candidatus Solibacter usitatus]|nr:hypothetical protein [Candidatus Solibacter usitatus]
MSNTRKGGRNKLRTPAAVKNGGLVEGTEDVTGQEEPKKRRRRYTKARRMQLLDKMLGHFEDQIDGEAPVFSNAEGYKMLQMRAEDEDDLPTAVKVEWVEPEE